MRLMLVTPELWTALAEAAKAAPDERWITVHPNGKDEPGHPVLIKVDPHNPRVGRIVGGAGGKLNYMQVHLKTPEEYRRLASIKRAEKRARADVARHGQAESTGKAESLTKLKEQRDQAEAAILKRLAQVMGWGEGDDVLAPEADALRGLDTKTADRIRKEHLRKLAADARAAGEAAKDLLVTDARARAEAGLGEVPLRADETRLGAEDLLTDKELSRAPGYRREPSGIEDDDLRAERVRALEGRLKDAAGGGAPEDAARLAKRLGRYRPIEEHEIDVADPSALAGWARLAWDRYDRFDNYIAARQDMERDLHGEARTEHPIPDDDRAELDGMGKLVAGVPLHDAIQNAHSDFGKKHLRDWLKMAARHGLLDPVKAKETERARDALRFEAAAAPKPEELTAEQVAKLSPQALDVLVEEAARRLRQDVTVAPEARQEAEQAQAALQAQRAAQDAEQGADGAERQQAVPGVTNPGPAQDLAEEALAAPVMDEAQKRAFLERALELRTIGTEQKARPTREEQDERRETRDTAIDDGAKAAQVLSLVQELRRVRHAERKARAAIERGEAVEGLDYDPERDIAPHERAARGGAVDLHVDPEAAEALVQSLDDEIRTRTARSFLDQLHEGYRDVASQDHLRAEEAADDLHRHLSFGAADALNNHGQTILGGPVLDRQTIDTLGADGAAQLLAWATHQQRGEDVEAIHAAVGDYHAGTQRETAEDAMAQAREEYEAAAEIHAGMLAQEGAADLTEWHALNRERLQHLHRARETLGRTLGTLEATAALHRAMKKPPTDEIRVSLGQTSVDTAASQARAIGLGPEDYEIHHDGTNAWLSVKAAGFPKLVREVDPAEHALHRDMEAIKAGHHDEDGWLPAGFARRSDAPEYRGPPAPQHAEPLDYGLEKHGSVRDAVATYIGQRVNDGWSPAQIHADLLRDEHRLGFERAAPTSGGQAGEHPGLAEWGRQNPEPERMAPSLFGGEEETEHWRAWKRARDEHAAQLGPAPAGDGGDAGAQRHREFHAALDELLPGRHEATGTKQMAENWGPHMRAMAEEYLATHRGGDTAGALHHQRLDPGHARDAAFRALARHPEAAAAWKPYEELTHADREALRLAYHRYHGRRPEEGGAGDPQHRIAAWERDNPEPERMAPSLFGGEEETEHWRAWKRDREAALGRFRDEARADEPLDWQGYTRAHRGSAAAYRAMQDLVKGRFLADFHAQYQGLAGQPLKAGVAPIEGWRQHRHAMDPEWREHERQRRQAAQGDLQARDRGRYAEDQVRARIDKRLEDEGALAQRQATAFGAAQDGEGRARHGGSGAPAGHERLTLGDSVEAQLAGLVRDHADLVDPRRPFAARTGITMDGDKVSQQRAIKAWLRAKRIGLFLGAGSGKTNVSFGAFGELRAKGQARRGLYAVPSIVQGQFGSEALAFLEPGKTRWWAKPGAPREERLRAYADPSHHMVVVTHQALRDDVTGMVARHLGTTPEEVATRMTGFGPDGTEVKGWSEEETDRHVADALRAHGADGLLDYMAVDEGHTALNRAGKRDSHLARVIDSLGRLSEHVGYMTGSPVKNDPSEIHDQLRKVAPHKYGDGEGRVSRAEFLRRYGADTTASAAALRRELGRHVFLGRVDPGTQPNYQHEVLPPSEGQRTRLAEIETAYLNARRAQQRGEVDVDAVRTLSPGQFQDAPAEQHRDVAKRLQANLGILREAAYNHAANLHEGNAKLDRTAELARQYKAEGRAGVVFARNLDAVDQIRQRLEADGHKVVTLTGKDGADAKARAKEAFQGGGADVIVLSDAGATGANLQRGSYLVQHDIPQTYMTWDQRQARINRLGQQYGAPDVHTLAIDHPWEHANRERLERKRALHEMLFDGAGERLDDTGLAHYLRQHLAQATAAAPQAAAPQAKGRYGAPTPVVQAEASRPTHATDFRAAFSGAKGTGEGWADAMWRRVQAGKDTQQGRTDAYLQAAAMVHQRQPFNREEFGDFLRHVQAVRDEHMGRPTYQRAMQDAVQEWASRPAGTSVHWWKREAAA